MANEMVYLNKSQRSQKLEEQLKMSFLIFLWHVGEQDDQSHPKECNIGPEMPKKRPTYYGFFGNG